MQRTERTTVPLLVEPTELVRARATGFTNSGTLYVDGFRLEITDGLAIGDVYSVPVGDEGWYGLA